MEIQEISERGRRMCLPLNKPRNRKDIREMSAELYHLAHPLIQVEDEFLRHVWKDENEEETYYVDYRKVYQDYLRFYNLTIEQVVKRNRPRWVYVLQSYFIDHYKPVEGYGVSVRFFRWFY